VNPLRVRRAVAALLAGAGLASLLGGAAVQEIPWADSLRMARRFWAAGPRGRLLNAPGFARDAGFASTALRLAAEWPIETDAVLAVGPAVPPELRERLRREAAYLLAPRRVLLEPGEGAEVSLRRAPTGGSGR
jgi:hypothetical protein